MKKIDHGIIVIVIYVDHLIITGDSDVDIYDLKKFLKQKLEMKDLGELVTSSALRQSNPLKGYGYHKGNMP